MTRIRLVGAIAFLLLLAASSVAWAQGSDCHKVGGMLMTNLGVIPLGPYGTTLGPVTGDLAGSVGAQILGNNHFQHYWVTASGDTIKLDVAVLTPAPTDILAGGTVIAIRWGHYSSPIIPGGTGKFKKATGVIYYSGLGDFAAGTLVLRYRGTVCYNDTPSVAGGD